MEVFLTDPTSHQLNGAIQNLGDVFIKEAILDHLKVASSARWVPLSGFDYQFKPGSRSCLILAGANVLSNNPFLNPWVWKPSLRQCFGQHFVVLFGVGWWQYQARFNRISRGFYRRALLGPPVMHSVRDGYTAQKLRGCGLTNVMNTGCPTMWKLPDHMAFEGRKPDRVVFTLTDYKKDPRNDTVLVDFVLEHYDEIYFFPQGTGDPEYLDALNPEGDQKRIQTLDRNVDAFDRLLQSQPLDYIGTRLHAGIRALQHGRRAFVLIVDNRAAEISRDTGLWGIPREAVQSLAAKIEKDFELELTLDRNAIGTFLESLEQVVSD